ncbi:hypothetical protein F4861DRAFT_506420 [Xylaria intraflava]|nr:hypothetical protein F4861DRAFT_506420 [Xylaria intraflava]
MSQSFWRRPSYRLFHRPNLAPDHLPPLEMLRPSQRLCRTAFARPIGLELPWESRHVRCPDAIIPVPRVSHLQASSLFYNPRPRYFTTSHTRRAESSKAPPREPTATLDTATPIHPDVSPSPSPETPKPRRRRGVYYIMFFILLGTAAGSLFRITVAPPALPQPGSEGDLYLQSGIQEQGAALPLVRQLSADPAWTSWDAYAGIPDAPSPANPQGISAVQSRITSGPMSGSSGLAFQRIFHNAATGEVVSVVYFGPALAGWPGVVHGGALATVLDESLGRCAILQFPSRTGVTANLELQYRAPTRTHNFYIIRARPMVDEAGVKNGSGRKLWVQATLETTGGKVNVESKALFVVPKGFELRPIAERF